MPIVPRPSSLRSVVRRSSRTARIPHIPDVDRSQAIVDFAVYRDGIREPDFETWMDAHDDVLRSGSGFVWIGLHDPSAHQLAVIGDHFGLHPLAVEDAAGAHQRPKVDEYDDIVFAVVKTVHYDEMGPHELTEVIDTGEIMAFLGENFVITVRHGQHGGLRALRRTLESDPGRLSRGPSAVLHGVLDLVVDNYVQVCDALQSDVDEAEVAVFAGADRSAQSNRMYILKREALTLRRVTAPLAAPLRRLGDGSIRLIAEDVHEYYRDVEDHLTQVVEQVAAFDELLNTLVNANLAQVSVAQNEDMRKISAWVAIAAVPTMVAGVYGMNFDNMPELHWRFGYFLVLGLVTTTCVLLFMAFKRNHWL